MAVASPAHEATPHHANHPDPLVIKRAGLWLFFFSESLLFGLLASARFYLEGIEADHLDQLLGLVITVVLLLSSVTAFTAETAMEHNRRKLFFIGMVATIVLGIAFGLGVAYEWQTAHFHRQEAFGTVFFAMTGLHASHVISGVGLLVLVLIQASRGRFNSKDHWPVSGAVMYWHFVDVVWVFYYPILYLVQGVE
jgi:cytochrome c oxidase subunit 3